MYDRQPLVFFINRSCIIINRPLQIDCYSFPGIISGQCLRACVSTGTLFDVSFKDKDIVQIKTINIPLVDNLVRDGTLHMCGSHFTCSNKALEWQHQKCTEWWHRKKRQTRQLVYNSHLSDIASRNACMIYDITLADTPKGIYVSNFFVDDSWGTGTTSKMGYMC